MRGDRSGRAGERSAAGGHRPPTILRSYAPGSLDRDTAPVAALSTRANRPRQGREFFRRIAELIAEAADALEHAHSIGIVHRDVKPGNLMLDAAGKLWVTDFGLARFGPDAGLTMTGDLLGTLRYMAPEQALARHGLADHRVDVYGLGCTLYELLTGKPAVGGDDKADILRQIAFEEPVAPRKLDKAIPAELETIALKCLAKNPNERYATAGELAADLRRFAGRQADQGEAADGVATSREAAAAAPAGFGGGIRGDGVGGDRSSGECGLDRPGEAGARKPSAKLGPLMPGPGWP